MGWVVSILIHAGLLGAMFFYKPFREAVFQPRRTEAKVTASSDTIQEVARIIRDENADMIRSDIQEMNRVLAEMEKLRRQKLEQYQQFEQELVSDSPRRALEAQDRALAAQQETISRQRGDVDQQKQALEQQAAVDAAQEKVANMLTWAGSPYAEALKAQQAAAAAQAEANRVQMEAQNALNPVIVIEDDLSRVLPQLKAAQQQKTQIEQQTAELTAPATDAEQKLAQAEEAVGVQEAELQAAEEAKRGKQGAELDTANQLAEIEKRDLERARQEREQAKREAEQATNRLNEQRRRIEETDRRIAEIQQRIDQSNAERQKHAQAAQPALAKAAEAQQQAMEAQRIAREALAKAIESGAAAEHSALAEFQPREGKSASELATQSIAELYQTARRTETEVAESFRELRAVELAQIREIDLEEAKESTDVPRPIRPELDTEILSGPARDAGTLNRQKEQVQTAVREVDSMVGLAYNLIHTAVSDGSGSGQGASVRVLPRLDGTSTESVPEGSGDAGAGGPTASAAEAYQSMVDAAVGDDNAVAKDLTKMMTQDIEADGQGEEEMMLMYSPGSPGGPPIIDPQNIGVVTPGRKITADGQPSEFLIVDSWYVIGPFPNPERKNIKQVFPPESVIDLDAVYTGKDGKPVRWQFVQSSGPRIEPPDLQEYAIYYAYTELRFDQDQDLWVAIGSDDYSKLWVNDYLVWTSGTQLKGWLINEGWRKVHFKEGLNRILYRVENGWMGMGWSMVIHTRPME